MNDTSPTFADPLLPLRRTLAVVGQSERRDLTLRQLAILLHLDRHPQPPPSVKDLTATLGMAKPTVSRSLDRLEFHMRFVTRQRTPKNRRQVEIALNDDGRAFVAALAGAMAAGGEVVS